MNLVSINGPDDIQVGDTIVRRNCTEVGRHHIFKVISKSGLHLKLSFRGVSNGIIDIHETLINHPIIVFCNPEWKLLYLELEYKPDQQGDTDDDL